MSSRWFNLSVLILWLSTMTWLMACKILPLLLIGEPPSYSAILKAREDDDVVGWRIECNQHEVGWAVSTSVDLPHGLNRLENYLHFNRLPLEEVIPLGLLRQAKLEGFENVRMPFTALSEFEFDPLGQMSRFSSKVRFQPGLDPFKVEGTIDGSQMTVQLHQGQRSWDTVIPAPRQAMLSDALSPQSYLPGLRDGQKWTVEVFSPLEMHGGTLHRDILYAKVEGTQSTNWEGREVHAWNVIYRSESGSGQQVERGRVLVLPGGKIVRQEVHFLACKIVFSRLGGSEAEARWEEAKQERKKEQP